MITLEKVSFDYFTFEKTPGIKGTLHDLFDRKTKKKRALDTLDLTIKDGELIGLIGPNGAGKTTLTKLLTGIISPSEGKIKIDKMTPYLHDKRLLQNVGVMFGQKSQLSWNLPTIDTVNMLAALYRLLDDAYQTRLNQLIDMLDITDLIKIPVRKLSLGQRVRCELLCALIHSPKYLFLDEPTLGLDLITQEHIYDFLKEENQKNHTTIIMTSHNIRDIEAVSKRLLILAQGKLIFDGTLKTLPVNLSQHQTFKIKYLLADHETTQEEVIAVSQLKKKLAQFDPKSVIAIDRQGMSVNDLILSIYQDWGPDHEKD